MIIIVVSALCRGSMKGHPACLSWVRLVQTYKTTMAFDTGQSINVNLFLFWSWLKVADSMFPKNVLNSNKVLTASVVNQVLKLVIRQAMTGNYLEQINFSLVLNGITFLSQNQTDCARYCQILKCLPILT